MIVIDSSIAFKWFFDEPNSDAALELLHEHPIAPDLVVVEVSNAAWKVSRRKLIPAETAIEIARRVPEYFSELVPSRLLVSRAVGIASDLDHPVYDALYIALALQADAELITADERLLRKTRRTVFAKTIHPLKHRP